MGFKKTKKSISILLLTIMLINAFPFIGTLEVYALTDDDWAKFQEQLPTGTPRFEQKYNKYEFNATYWQQDDLIVYGTFSSVKREGIANDQDDYGEYRYLGFDKNGNPFSNEKFTNDAYAGGEWVDRNWIEEPWNEPATGIDKQNDWSTKEEYRKAINRMATVQGLDTYGWTPNNSGSYFGYVHVQSYPTLLDKGSGRVWHETSSGAIFYKTFTIPVLDHREEMIPIEVTAKCLSNDFTIEEGENIVNMKIKVTAKVPDDSVYNEPYKKVLYYTRDDIKKWYIKLEYLGESAFVEIESDGSNTASKTFEFPLSRSQVYDGQAITFTGIGRVIYHDSKSDVDSDSLDKTFTVEELDEDEELPPGIYIEAPSEVNVNEEYIVKVTPVVPENEEVKSLKLERQIGVGAWENVPMSDNKATHSYPIEKGIEYKATIELENLKKATATAYVEIVDNRAATATADVEIPEYVYEACWFRVKNKNQFYFDGKSYNAKEADELGIGDSRFRFQDNTGFRLNASEYETDDFDHDEGGKVKFDEPGMYKIYLEARPKNGDRVSDTETIQVLPCPHVKGMIRGFKKDDRKIILDFTSTVVRTDSPLNDSKTKVTIEDLETGEKVVVTNSLHPNSTHIKTNAMSDNQLEFLIKTSKDKNFKATIEVEDSRGEKDTDEIEFTVIQDKAPIPKITAMAQEIRNPEKSSKAEIVLEDDSYSEDADYITREWQVAIDTDNDNSFSDETYKNITTLDGYKDLSGKGNKKKVSFLKTGVGKVAIRLNIKETFGQATIDAFVTDADRLRATKDKVIDIINIAPHVDFKLSSMDKKDIYFIAEESKVEEIENNITEFKADLLEKQVNAKTNIITHKPIQEELLKYIYYRNFELKGDNIEAYDSKFINNEKDMLVRYSNRDTYEICYVAFNLDTGVKVWESEWTKDIKTIQLFDGRYMVAYCRDNGYSYYVKVYDYATGEVLWESDKDHELKFLTFKNGMVFIQTRTSGYCIRAYNCTTGELLWESDKGDKTPIFRTGEEGSSIFMIKTNYSDSSTIKIYDYNFNLLGTMPNTGGIDKNDIISYTDISDEAYTFYRYNKYGELITQHNVVPREKTSQYKRFEDNIYVITPIYVNGNVITYTNNDENCKEAREVKIYTLNGNTNTVTLERSLNLIHDPWTNYNDFRYEIDNENNILYYYTEKQEIDEDGDVDERQMVLGSFSLVNGSNLYENELPYDEDEIIKGCKIETINDKTFFIFPRIKTRLPYKGMNVVFPIYNREGTLVYQYYVDTDDYDLDAWVKYDERFLNEDKIYMPYGYVKGRYIVFNAITETGYKLNLEDVSGAYEGMLWSQDNSTLYYAFYMNDSAYLYKYTLRNTLKYAYKKAVETIDTWRGKAEKYVVPINFDAITLTDEAVTEITNILSDTTFSFIGDSDSQEVGQRFADETGGTFYNATSIKNGMNQFKNDLTPDTDEPVYEYYFTKDDVINYNIFYTDYEIDPSKQSQWRYVHTPKSDGLIENNKQWLNEPIIQFDKDGTYRVQHRQIDDTGVATYDKWSNIVEMTIYIVDGDEPPPPPPEEFEEKYTPVGMISLTGSQKQNRKLTLNLEYSEDNNFSLETTSIQWTLSPVSGLSNSDIKKPATTGQSIDTLCKKAGQVKATVTFKDIKGNTGTATKIFDIVQDEDITGNIMLEPVLYRNAESKATQTVNVEVTSNDDYIETLKHYITYDSNNDGSFTDETATELTAYENMREFAIDIDTGVGDYKVTSIATEGFIEETIPAYVSETDYHNITLEEIFKVDNIAPMYDIRTNKSIYLVGDDITYISNFTDTELNGDYRKGYFDVEKDTMQNFRAKYTQDRAFMPNQDAESEYHNIEMTELTKTLDRAGEYTISTYAVDDPKNADSRFSEFERTSNTSTNTIIVHRPPVARATFDVVSGKDFNDNMYLEGTRLRITDNSSDPDGYSVTSTISYKVGNGAYTTINSGNTITLVHGELVTVKVQTEDNWGATDTELTTITVINDLNMQPDIQPNPVPASEKVTLTLTTNQYATSARVEILGDNVELNLTNETATEKTWEAQYPIPVTTVDKTYTAQFYATSEGLVEIQEDKVFVVETPIDLIGTINDKNANAEVFADEENSFKFYTSTYVSNVELNFMGTTYTRDDGEILLLGDNGTSKTWEILLNVPSTEVTDGETGIATFTANLPSGKQESVEVNYKIITIKLEDLRIINIGDYNWESYFAYANGAPTPLQREGIQVKDMPIDRNRQGRGIKLGYKVLFEIDSKGLHQEEDTIDIDVHFFALDRENEMHEVDVYVENEKGEYIKLEDSEYRSLSKEIQLNSKNRDISEPEPNSTIANTWYFGIFLPYTAKIVKSGETLDLYNDNTFDYRLMVALNITGRKSTGGSFDYTRKELEWGTGDGHTYGINKSTSLDLLKKGINHGEVFWYNLYETLLEDIHIDRRW